MKVTQGTETSKYLEEEKETSISLVVASERERAQTGNLFPGLWTVYKVRKFLSRAQLESWTTGGNSPVCEKKRLELTDPEYHETRETLWEAGGTTPQG